MTEKETAGARWFREESERRARQAADAERVRRQKGLAAMERARAIRESAVQEGFGRLGTGSDDERTLMERILAEPDPRSRERLEAELQVLRARMKREPGRQR